MAHESTYREDEPHQSIESDQESRDSEHGHEIEIEHNVTRQKPRTEPRKSMLDEHNDNGGNNKGTVFWKITNFKEVQAWNPEQQAYAIKQVHRLAKQYALLFEDHSSMLTKIELLEKDIEEKDEAIQHLKMDVEDQDREITKREGAIEFLRQQRQYTEESTPSAPNPQPKSKVKALPDPDKFSGFKSTIPFDQWRMQIQDKLTTDDYLFDTEERKIKYVGNSTSGDAYNHIWPKLADKEFKTAEEVLQTLADIYDDPNKKQKAKKALAKLFQGNWDFHRYHAEFAKVVRPLKLKDDDLKEELLSKLNEKYAMATLDAEDLTYAELVKKLHAVDRRLLASRDLGPRPPRTTNPPNDGPAKPPFNDKPSGSSTTRTREEFEALFQARLCKKCCKPTHTQRGERCAEPKWAPLPASVLEAMKKVKQVNNVEAELEAAPTDPKN
jgi:hypothetical protein